MEFMLVFIGGGIGSLLRYLINLFFTKDMSYLATIISNLLACFIIGIIFGLILYKFNSNKYFALLLITGFCGGFSTFSAYSLDIINMIRNGNYVSAIIYMVSTVILCLCATSLGIFAINLMNKQ